MILNCAGIGESTPPAPQLYTISSSYCRSITVDGTYGTNVTTKESEAYNGDTVTFAIIRTDMSGYDPIVRGDQGDEYSYEYVSTYQTGGGGRPPAPIEYWGVYRFVMPSDNVTITYDL